MAAQPKNNTRRYRNMHDYRNDRFWQPPSVNIPYIPAISGRPIDDDQYGGDWRNLPHSAYSPPAPPQAQVFGSTITRQNPNTFVDLDTPAASLLPNSGHKKDLAKSLAAINIDNNNNQFFSQNKLDDFMNQKQMTPRNRIGAGMVKPGDGYGSGPGQNQTSIWDNLFGGAWDWIGGHPLDAAKIGLGGLQYFQKNRQLDQWDDYQDDVRAQMAFDQKDVDRRWDLTMKDWESRQARDAAFDHSQRLATV